MNYLTYVYALFDSYIIEGFKSSSETQDNPYLGSLDGRSPLPYDSHMDYRQISSDDERAWPLTSHTRTRHIILGVSFAVGILLVISYLILKK